VETREERLTELKGEGVGMLMRACWWMIRLQAGVGQNQRVVGVRRRRQGKGRSQPSR
jgi:hypothetical protein